MKKILLLFLIIFNTYINYDTKNYIKVNKLDYFKNYYNNSDIIGSIKIDDTKIDSLLVKSDDNEFYLNHDLYKNFDIKGTIFVDYRVNLNSDQINIYGHNSNVYDVQFKDLENYLKKDFYVNHRYINLWDGVNEYIYEIFSIQLINDDYEHMIVNPKNKIDHIKKLSKSIYDTGVNVDINDNILILQTCSYDINGKYILISAKKI